MEEWFVLVPVTLTSAAALVWRGRRRHDGGRSLWTALSEAAETVGLSVLFFLANVGVGALVTLVARAFDLTFISIYLSTDVSLLVLSLFQALVYQRWRDLPSRPNP